MLWASHAQQIWCGRYKTNSNSRSIIKREVQRQKNVTPSPAPPPPPPPPPQESNSFAAAAAATEGVARFRAHYHRSLRTVPSGRCARSARRAYAPATRYPLPPEDAVAAASFARFAALLAMASGDRIRSLSRRWTRPRRCRGASLHFRCCLVGTLCVRRSKLNTLRSSSGHSLRRSYPLLRRRL